VTITNGQADPLDRLLAETTADPRRRLLLELVRELLADDPSATDGTTFPTADELLDGLAREMGRRGCLPNSIDARRRRVRALMAWAEPRSVLELTPEDVEGYLDDLEIESNSRRGYLSQFHAFYRWTVAQGYITTPPTAGIVRPKQRNGRPRPLTDAELERAIAPESFLPDDPPHRSLRCLVLLGAFAGLRAQEMSYLEVRDVDLEHNLIQVRKGKGGKQRVVPLHPETRAALERMPMPESGFVFKAHGNGRDGAVYRDAIMGPQCRPVNVSHRVRWHLNHLGIDGGPHRLRHTFASAAYRASKDLRLVQELLGHSSPAVTAIYAAADDTQAAAVVMGLGRQS